MLTSSVFLFLSLAATGEELPTSQPTAESAAAEAAEQPLLLEKAQDKQESAQKPKWTGAITVGASFTDGNTDIKRTDVTADATKTIEKDRYTLGFAYNYAKQDDVTTQDRTFAKGQYDRFIDERSYFLGLLTAEQDDQADLDLRWTAGVGYGYQFRNDDEWKLAAEAGLSYFSEEFKNGDDSNYVAARVGWNAAWNYSKRWQFSQTGQIFPSLEDSEDVFGQADTRAKATLTENMFAQLQWLFSWDNTPAPGKDRADHLFALTVGWSF